MFVGRWEVEGPARMVIFMVVIVRPLELSLSVIHTTGIRICVISVSDGTNNQTINTSS